MKQVFCQLAFSDMIFNSLNSFTKLFYSCGQSDDAEHYNTSLNTQILRNPRLGFKTLKDGIPTSNFLSH